MLTLREVVGQLIDSKDESSHSFRRLYNLGVWGMKVEFNLDVKNHIRTALLDINPNKTCELPCDYVTLSKMGVVNSYGEIATFKLNNRLSMYHAEYFSQTTNRNTGVPTLPTYGWYAGLNGGLVDYNAFAYLNYWYSGTTFNLYGLGSGTAEVGEYKIDETNRIILFNERFNWTQFLLEYMSDGSDEENDDYPVDIRMAEAVKCWLRWQDKIDKKNVGIGEKNKLKLDYYNQKRLSRMRLNPIILNEMQNIERRSWRMVAKA